MDDTALLDFENATGGCVNGTPDVNDRVTGTAPAGHYTGLRFTLGVPFNKNHTDLTTQPSPLNLTALAWVWNAGRKFARLRFFQHRDAARLRDSPRQHRMHAE